MTFEPNLTQRIVRKAKGRIVHDWKARLGDYSSRIAQWGALVQGALLMVPADDLAQWGALVQGALLMVPADDLARLPANLSAYLALAMFVLIGAAKLITEPGK